MAETTSTPPEAERAPAHTGAPSRPRDVAERAVDEVKALGTELFSAARDSARNLIDEQRRRAANEVHAVGDVLRSTVKSLDDAGAETIARYAKDAACQVDNVAERLRKSSWQELQADIESFARNYPIAFIAISAGLGFAVGRVMVSSAPRRDGRMEAGPLDGLGPLRERGSAETVGYAAPGSTGI